MMNRAPRGKGASGPQAGGSKTRVNQEIRVPRVRVIGEDGEQLGILTIEDALRKAEAAELDLVEVAPNGDPPVCRIMNFSKQLFMEEKKRREARRKSSAHDIKSVRLKPRIGRHDLEIKVNQARYFLEEGRRVRFEMQYKGRELAHMEIGESITKDVVALLSDIAKVEGNPYREGRRVSLTLAPKFTPQEMARMKAKQAKSGGETPVGPATTLSAPAASVNAAPPANPQNPEPVAPQSDAGPIG